MKFRILYQHQKYYPQYKYKWWPFWFNLCVDSSPFGSFVIGFNNEETAKQELKKFKTGRELNKVREVIKVEI